MRSVIVLTSAGGVMRSSARPVFSRTQAKYRNVMADSAVDIGAVAPIASGHEKIMPGWPLRPPATAGVNGCARLVILP
jgi:hypothetical protein